ncbi:MAG: hypothetical protein WKF84_04970 [Pyrinomonadaceae bacterium]
MSAKLGEILVRENFLSAQQLRSALDYQRAHGGRLSYNLVRLGLVPDEVITAVLSRQYGVQSVNLSLFELDLQILSLIPREVAEALLRCCRYPEPARRSRWRWPTRPTSPRWTTSSL